VCLKFGRCWTQSAPKELSDRADTGKQDDRFDEQVSMQEGRNACSCVRVSERVGREEEEEREFEHTFRYDRFGTIFMAAYT